MPIWWINGEWQERPKEKRIINLWHEIRGIIVSHPTEAWYSNQTGGHGCYHPIYEGFFVPMDQIKDIEEYIIETFGSWCTPGDLKRNHIAQINRIFKKYNYPLVFDVKRKREAMEAWIPITIVEKVPRPKELYEYCDQRTLLQFAKKEGVYTYPNSD